MRSGTELGWFPRVSYLLSICKNRAIWRPSCIPYLQYVEGDIEGTFEGIVVTLMDNLWQRLSIRVTPIHCSR